MKKQPNLDEVIADIQKMIDENPRSYIRYIHIGTLMDILYHLKEQEPVLLKNQHKPGGHIINANSPWISRCPRCGRKVEGRQTRYCKYCGQAVKWE